MLSDIDKVKEIQSNLRTTLETPAGKEVIKFLEDICGWYDFQDTEPNMILIKHGKRQVLATIKTLMRLKPEEIVALSQEQ